MLTPVERSLIARAATTLSNAANVQDDRNLSMVERVTLGAVARALSDLRGVLGSDSLVADLETAGHSVNPVLSADVVRDLAAIDAGEG